MANIASDNMAKITARLGVARLGCSRIGCAPVASQLKPGSTGQIIFNRENNPDGDPVYSTATWTNVRGED
jgi:hypothetical protein